ncbi:MAG: molybdenum cofactor biosynthesis protein MoaE [Deltaproteobacteria bacterium]|nr:molybdenum cofactor biosynthesis protein MoaE [Deltaproteobacteria bacterium]
MKSSYSVTSDSIDTEAMLAEVGDAAAGGTTLFLGTTRNENEGRVVERLEYEAYEAMALEEMRRIGDEMARRWRVVAISVVHRVGVVPIGQASVAVAVSAAHREEAFAACRYGIDTLKATVPIWKKEFYQGGEHWVGPCHAHGASGRG